MSLKRCVNGLSRTEVEFRGSNLGATHAGRFAVSLLRSRSARPDAHVHSHHRAHVVIPLDQGFRSDAHGYMPARPGGQAVFTPAGWSHRDSMANLDGRFAVISLEKADEETGSKLPDHSFAFGQPHSLALAHGLIAAAMADEPLPDLWLESLCTELFGFSAGAPSRGDAAPWLNRAYERLSAGPPFPSISDLAREAGVTPAHFARTFRRSFDCAPSEARLWIQTWRAARRLRDESTDLAHVASDEGFADQSHFGRIFRRLFRCTPAAYRRILSSRS